MVRTIPDLGAIPWGGIAGQTVIRDLAAASGVSWGTLPAAGGGTGIASYAIGDLLYASGATTLARLADVAVNQALVSGGVGVAPAWSSTPTLGGLTLTGTLAMGANAITNAPSLIGGTAVGSSLNLQSTSTNGTTDFIRFLVGNNGATEAMRITHAGVLAVGTATPDSSGIVHIAGDVVFGKTTGSNNFYVGDSDGGNRVRFGYNTSTHVGIFNCYGAGVFQRFDIQASPLLLNYDNANARVGIGVLDPAGALHVGPGVNVSGLVVSGYSLTGSTAVSIVDLAATVNTSGVVDVWKLAVTDTAHGALSNLLAIYGGAGGATARFSIDTAGKATAVALSLTQAAATAPSTSLIAAAVNKYGGDTNYLGDPTEWITVTTVNGTRKIPAYA